MGNIAQGTENWQGQIPDLDTTRHFWDALRRAEVSISQSKLDLRRLSIHTESPKKQAVIRNLVCGMDVCADALQRLKGGKPPKAGAQ